MKQADRYFIISIVWLALAIPTHLLDHGSGIIMAMVGLMFGVLAVAGNRKGDDK